MDKEITQKEVNAALDSKKKFNLSCGGGLRLQLNGQGQGSWVYSGRLHDGTGKLKLITLGKAPFMTLKGAKMERSKVIAELLNGIDRNAEKKTRRAEAEKKDLTFLDVAQRWYIYWKGSVAPKTAQAAKGRLNNYFIPAIGDKPFSELTRADYAAIVMAMPGETPKSAAYKACSMLNDIEKFAIDTLNHGGNRADGLSRLLHGKPEETTHHPTILTLPELKNALSQIELFYKGGQSSLAIRSAVKLVTLTALRVGALVQIQWPHVDLENAMLHLPADIEKDRRPLDLPLSRQSVDIFRDLLTCRSSESPYVFSSYRRSGFITGEAVLRAVKKIIDPALIKNHGWRSVFLTQCKNAGWPHNVVRQCISHSKDGTAADRAYDHADLMPVKRQLVQWYADFLDAVRTGTELPKVPNLGGKYTL